MRSNKEISVGARARAARGRLGLNQSEIAERVGISNEVYGRFERGLITPRVQTLLRVCAALQVTPNDLLLDVKDGSAAARPEDRLSPDVRRLVNVLDDADVLTVRRVTEVARWLHGGAVRLNAVRAADGRGPKWKTKQRRPSR